jgi:hypothetical protein
MTDIKSNEKGNESHFLSFFFFPNKKLWKREGVEGNTKLCGEYLQCYLVTIAYHLQRSRPCKQKGRERQREAERGREKQRERVSSSIFYFISLAAAKESQSGELFPFLFCLTRYGEGHGT